MSDVEKAISGLIEDEELLQTNQQQHQQQQHHSTPLNNKANSYNTKNDSGNSFLQQQQQQQQRHQQKQQQLSQHQLEQQLQYHRQHHPHTYIPDSKYLSGGRKKPNTNNRAININNCLSRALKLIFSTPGLVVMVIGYTIMGALVFPLLEAPQDISKSAIIAKSREECLKELWIITEKLNVLYERNWTMLVHEQLRRFEGTIVAATRNGGNGAGNMAGVASSSSSQSSSSSSSSTALGGSGGGGGGGGLATDISSAATTSVGRFGGNYPMENNDFTATKWSFSEALLYSVTVITTIGHGSLTPRTTGGKIATIFYALIGVPLMLMCLSSLGGILAEALQCTYARLCCRGPQYVHDNPGHRRNRQGGGGGGGGGDGGDDSDADVDVDDHNANDRCGQKSQHKQDHCLSEKDTSYAGLREHHQCEFESNHKHGINCKNCKYDAIIGVSSDTNPNNVYDSYKCTTNTQPEDGLKVSSAAAAASASATASPILTTKSGYKEAGKLNQQQQQQQLQQYGSCMQLKMSPAMGGTITGQQQQAQHQQLSQQHPAYYQQRPDVMLMASTTGHKLSSPGSGNCRLLMPNTSTAGVGGTTPRYFAPPMATYHIVSSTSNNSSPTHQQSIRHYIIPPPGPPGNPATLSGAQHFMAVPTNMLRFQTSAVHCGGGAGVGTNSGGVGSSGGAANLSINPLASGSTTTVYFPIVTPVGSGAQNPLALSGTAAAPTATTTITSTSNNTLLGTMSGPLPPMLKYHTIQMPHRRKQSLTLANGTNAATESGSQQQQQQTEMLPPPPPAYQTATVHGIRRAKFLTKPPLPPEINTLLHENDISCRHDLSQNPVSSSSSSSSSVVTYSSGGEQQQQQQSVMATPSTTTSQSVTLSAEHPHQQQLQYSTHHHQQQQQQNINNLYSNTTAAICSATVAAQSSTLTNNPGSLASESTSTSASPLTLMSSHSHFTQATTTTTGDIGNTQSLGGAAATMATVVDIMEDEEELEQQRLGNCPHGTPSRVPLLTCNSATSTHEDKSATRSFLQATAATFQRHTSSFQRNHPQQPPPSATATIQRKSMIINHKGECNLHVAPKRRNSAICYRDHHDTSEDDDEFMEGQQNTYKLKDLQQQQHHQQTDKLLHATMAMGNNELELDNNSLVSYGGDSTTSSQQLPQVPLLLVLIILVFYVCLGTVIFALWENWSLIDGAYFCFVTLTTIGYGDFVPMRTFQGPEIQLFACCAYLLLGLVLVAMSFSILETQLIWKCKRLAVRLKLTRE